MWETNELLRAVRTTDSNFKFEGLITLSLRTDNLHVCTVHQ